MPSIYDRIYAASPVSIQTLGINLYGLIWKERRYGGVFNSLLHGYHERESYSPGDWVLYQTKELSNILISAWSTPYYRDIFSRTGLDLQNLSDFSLNDLMQLPLLDRESIRKMPALFISDPYRNRKLNTYSTSGTTGTPLAIKYSAEMDQKISAAYEARVRNWAGVNYKMSRGMIGGRLVVPQGNAKPPFWRYNAIERQLYMSAFHISPKTAFDYANALNHYRPDYLVGYASSHFFLARFISNLGLSVYQPKAVLTSSEKMTDEMRQVIETVYRCPVYDSYSGVENCCLASECEHHSLHISPDVGLVELIKPSGEPAGPGEEGEIVATGFLNHAQPLIRYRTGDIAVWDEKQCKCGRQMPILKELVGRLEDTVIGPDGRETVRFHGIFVGIPSIREGQVIQEKLDQIRLRLVVDPGFGENERNLILKRFKERLGEVNLIVELVDQIERTERGKFRAVICQLSEEEKRQYLH